MIRTPDQLLKIQLTCHAITWPVTGEMSLPPVPPVSTCSAFESFWGRQLRQIPGQTWNGQLIRLNVARPSGSGRLIDHPMDAELVDQRPKVVAPEHILHRHLRIAAR